MIRRVSLLFKKLGVNNQIELKALVFQFIKFGLVGLSNTLVSWTCYYIFLLIDERLYMAGCIVGGVLSIANAFFWNDRVVFKGTENGWKSKLTRLGKTYVSYGGTSLLSMFLLWVEVRFFGIGKALAPIVNLFFTIPLNFVINKLWTFKNGAMR